MLTGIIKIPLLKPATPVIQVVRLVAGRQLLTVFPVRQESICLPQIAAVQVAMSMDIIKIQELKRAKHAIQVAKLVADRQPQTVFPVIQENICLPQITVV